MNSRQHRSLKFSHDMSGSSLRILRDVAKPGIDDSADTKMGISQTFTCGEKKSCSRTMTKARRTLKEFSNLEQTLAAQSWVLIVYPTEIIAHFHVPAEALLSSVSVILRVARDESDGGLRNSLYELELHLLSSAAFSGWSSDRKADIGCRAYRAHHLNRCLRSSSQVFGTTHLPQGQSGCSSMA